jgi:hypothetical protein
MRGSVQPLTGEQLEDLKEGARAQDMRQIYTETPMYSLDQGHDRQDYIDIPDEVSGNLVRYRVTKVEWFGVISRHYRVTVEKTDVP